MFMYLRYSSENTSTSPFQMFSNLIKKKLKLKVLNEFLYLQKIFFHNTGLPNNTIKYKKQAR